MPGIGDRRCSAGSLGRSLSFINGDLMGFNGMIFLRIFFPFSFSYFDVRNPFSLGFFEPFERHDFHMSNICFEGYKVTK